MEGVCPEKYIPKLLAGLEDPYQLGEEWIRKAQEELNEDPATVRDHVKALRDMIQAEDGLFSRTDDTFLLAFLRAKKHNIEEAFRVLKNYYRIKTKYPKYFQLCLPSTNKDIYDLQFISILDDKDQFGRPVIIFRADFDGYKVTCEQFIQLTTIMLEMCILDPQTQISGISVITDLRGHSLKHARFMSPTFLRLIIRLIQDSFPIRFKMGIIINEGYLFHALFALMIPFMKEKIRSRFHSHGRDLSKLHASIAPEILPNEWGGTRGPLQSTLQNFQRRITPYELLFREWTKYGYKEAS